MSNNARRTTRILAGVLAGALALSVTPILGFTGTAGALDPATGDGSVCEDVTPATEPFTDIAANDSAINEIICLVATGITKGKTATTYAPLDSVSRRQMALFLVRLADEVTEHAVPGQVTALPAADGTTPFTDIAAESAEVKAAVDRLEAANIAEGVTATTFVPGAFVTRRQMANFIVRLQEFMAGADVTPDNAPNAFTDDNGDTGEPALNVLAAEGVFVGNAAPNAGTVSPGRDISRRQMAFVIIRKAQYLFEEGVITRLFAEDDGDSGIVTSDNADPTTFDTADGKHLEADLSDGDAAGVNTFFVDGASATAAAFQAAATRGDTIVVTDSDKDGDYDVFRLTNAPIPASGLVGFVDTVNDDFAIMTSGGTKLTTHFYGDANDTYTVNGAAVSLAGFEAALSMGDTVATTDTTTPADGDPETYALTNGTWTGAVSDIGGVAAVNVTFFAGGSGDEPDNSADADPFNVVAAEVTGATQVLTIGGAAATFAQFEAAITNGDTVAYSRAAGVETFALTNVVVDLSFSGITDDSSDTLADTLGYISGTIQTDFDYSAVTNFRVNGVVSTEAEFEAALEGPTSLPFGEAVTFTGATGVLAITTATAFGPNPFSDVDTTDDGDLSNESIDIDNASGLTYTDLNAETAYGTTIPRWFVNGTEVTEAVYEDYLLDIDADGNQTGDSFEIRLVALATEHRLTTNNTL